MTIRSTTIATDFVFWESDKLTSVNLYRFKTENNEDVYVDRVMARPSSKRFALVLAPKDQQLIPWLVNLTTMVGKPFPSTFSGVLDAAFSPDGQKVYVVYKDGISRFDLDFKNVEMIDNTINSQWGVYKAKLSPTLDYLFFVAGTTESPLPMIYKLPKT